MAGMVWNDNTKNFENPTIQGSGLNSNWANNQGGVNDLSQSFDFGMNLGTLQLGTAAFGAYNGWQANKAAAERNEIARAELGQNAKSFDINAGMQLETLRAEEGRKNNYAGGFLDSSQSSTRFQDYQLDKLGSYNVG